MQSLTSIKIVLMWVAVGILQVALDGIGLYLSFGVWLILLCLATSVTTANVVFSLASLFCAGVVISGIATVSS